MVISYLASRRSDARETVRLVEVRGSQGCPLPRRHPRGGRPARQIIDTAVAELGGIDILVNNAAYQMAQPGGIVDITTEQFDRVMKTNLYAMFWLCKNAVPHLQPGATIINTSSVQAYPVAGAAGLRDQQGRHPQLHQGAGDAWPSRASGSTRSRPARSGPR